MMTKQFRKMIIQRLRELGKTDAEIVKIITNANRSN